MDTQYDDYLIPFLELRFHFSPVDKIEIFQLGKKRF